MKYKTIIGGVIALLVLVAFSLPTEVWGQREQIQTPEYVPSVRTAKKVNPCASLDKQTKQCIRRISKNQAKKQIEKMDSGIAFYKKTAIATMHCKSTVDYYSCILPEFSPLYFAEDKSIGILVTKDPPAFSPTTFKCDKSPNDALFGDTFGVIGELDKTVYVTSLEVPLSEEAELKEKMAEYSLVRDVMKIIYCIDVSGELKLIGQ